MAEKEMVDVLVVEDSPTQAEELRLILESRQYSVCLAPNGRNALEQLDRIRPEVVITDILMPEMDGYELCRNIKASEKWKTIPVMLLTALSDPEDVIKGLECKADAFLNKPYDRSYLLSRIQHIILNREIRKTESMQMGVEIIFREKKYFITSDRLQILNLLLSTFEAAVHKNIELEKVNRELKHTLETVKHLRGLLPICSSCKKIRNDSGYWQHVEAYISEHTDVDFTHGICPDCIRRIYPGYQASGKK